MNIGDPLTYVQFEIQYEMLYDRTWKKLPLNTGKCLIKVTTWAGLIVINKTIGWSGWYIFGYDINRLRFLQVYFATNSNLTHNVKGNSHWLHR